MRVVRERELILPTDEFLGFTLSLQLHLDRTQPTAVAVGQRHDTVEQAFVATAAIYRFTPQYIYKTLEVQKQAPARLL